MNEFDYDVKQKKNIAHGAFARKRGSKSKKCTLPSDLLTDAQKRKLNGPCASVKLGAPMTWGAFLKLTPSLAEEYLKDLRDSYDVTQQMLAQMFCVHFATVGRVMAERGLSDLFPKTRTTKEKAALRQAKWDAFCHGVVGGGSNSIIEDANDQIETENDEVESPTEVEIAHGDPEIPVCTEAPKPDPVHATTLCASFNGFPDLATLESFYRLVGADKVRVTISVEVMDHA